MKKNDIILIAALLVAALLAFFGIRWYGSSHTEEAAAVVTIDGEEYGRYPLSRDHTEKIKISEDAFNVLVIKDGEADMTEASCPDKICVNHKKISKRNESIVCLPNKVVVTIENGEEPGVDALAR